MDKVLHFRFEKETKGAVRYQETNEDGSEKFAADIGTLYVRKSAMPAGLVKALVVTVKG